MLKTIIRLPDGTEISSGSNVINAIQSATLTECVNSGEDLTIGSTCANALEATLITPNGGLSIAAGTRIAVLKQDGNSEPVQVGVFNLEKPTRPTANTMKLTGYDRVVELDKDLTDWLNALYRQENWSYTLNTFAGMVCAACGLTFKVSDVPNADFPVPRFTRSAVTGRQLMQWLGEICCRFCRADPNGNIEFAWYEPSGKTITPTGELYYLQNGLSYEDYKTAKIDAVRLRLANSQNGALWPDDAGGANAYIITDNAILNAKITNDLLPYLQVIQEALAGVEHTPCKVTIPAGLDIHAGNTVQIIDKNGNAITAYVMTKTQTGQKDTLECTGNIRRDAPTAVSNQAKPAGSAAQDAFNNMTQEQLFNKLTDDGKIQGLYVQDGKWYINAEVAQIINLIAEKLRSVLGSCELLIDGATLSFTNNGKETFAIRNWGNGSINMFMMNETGTPELRIYPGYIGLGESAAYEPDAMLAARGRAPSADGRSVLQVDEIRGNEDGIHNFRIADKVVSWKDNGDGTFTLIGQ